MALLKLSSLAINGVTMPAPQAPGGMTIKQEKIWSENTNRSADGTMLGTIIAIKTTVEIKWVAMTPDDVATLEAAVSDVDNPFVPVTYTDQTGQTSTITVYFGTPSYTCFDWIGGQWMVTDVAVEGIQQ